jgi:hypothetical protein
VTNKLQVISIREGSGRKGCQKGKGLQLSIVSHDLHVIYLWGGTCHHMWGQHTDKLIAYRARLSPKNFWSSARGIGSRREAVATRLGFGAATTQRSSKGVPSWTGKHTSLTGRPRSPRKRRHNIKGVSIPSCHPPVLFQTNSGARDSRPKSKSLRFLQPRQARETSSTLPRCTPASSLAHIRDVTTNTTSPRSKRSASMFPSSTVSPMTRPRDSLPSSALRAWAKLHYCEYPHDCTHGRHQSLIGDRIANL